MVHTIIMERIQRVVDLTVPYNLNSDMIFIMLMWLVVFERFCAAYVPPEYVSKSGNADYAGLAGLVANLASNYILFEILQILQSFCSFIKNNKS